MCQAYYIPDINDLMVRGQPGFLPPGSSPSSRADRQMTAERKYHVQHSTAAMVSLHMEKCQLGCDLKEKQELAKQRKGLAGKSRLQRGRWSMVCWETENKFVAPKGDHWVLCLPPLPLFLPFKNKLHLFTYVYVGVCMCGRIHATVYM